jgi:hypothetical protein
MKRVVIKQAENWLREEEIGKKLTSQLEGDPK